MQEDWNCLLIVSLVIWLRLNAYILTKLFLLSSLSLACLFTSFFLRLFWWSKKLFNVGFSWHIFQFCVFHYVPYWLYPLCIVNQYCETRSINFSFFFLTMACVVCETFKILAKNWVLMVFKIVLTWMCACGNKHMMVTYIRLDATIQ